MEMTIVTLKLLECLSGLKITGVNLNTPLSTGFLQLKIPQSRHISLDLLLKLLQLLFLPIFN